MTAVAVQGRVDPGVLVEAAGELAPQAVRAVGPVGATRCWELLCECAEFEAWAIGWPPGGSIELHDHGGALGAVVVASGELIETRVCVRRGRVTSVVSAIGLGESLELGPDCVHDVVNNGASAAVSVHVYSPRLTRMTYYRVRGDGLDPVRTVGYERR